MARTFQTIWCDDVRMEVGNKMSLMGVYSSELLVPTFPFVLQKLCLSCKVRTEIKKPFKQLKIVVSKNNEVMAELDMTETLSEQENVLIQKKDGAKYIDAQSFIFLGQMIIDKSSIFRVKAITETGVIQGHGLRVELAQQITA
jgi:hypothetical protein